MLLEASAASLPIVSTNVGGVSEIVLDGKSGLLVQESSTEAFSEAMWQLCQMSAGERQEMGNQGRAWVLESSVLNRFSTVGKASIASCSASETSVSPKQGVEAKIGRSPIDGWLVKMNRIGFLFVIEEG